MTGSADVKRDGRIAPAPSASEARRARDPSPPPLRTSTWLTASSLSPAHHHNSNTAAPTSVTRIAAPASPKVGTASTPPTASPKAAVGGSEDWMELDAREAVGNRNKVGSIASKVSESSLGMTAGATEGQALHTSVVSHAKQEMKKKQREYRVKPDAYWHERVIKTQDNFGALYIFCMACLHRVVQFILHGATHCRPLVRSGCCSVLYLSH